jgi:methionyl-tRNA formyltransferase
VQDKVFKIGYFADGPWSHRALELLLQDSSLSIEFIVPRIDTQDQTLLIQSKKHGIDYLHPVKINSADFIEQARSYSCDLFVSMSFNQIFRKEIINIPRLKTINCHAGKLPFYRGRNILNWALINDETEFGITVHYIDEGIDTGDIILQTSYPITDKDDYSTLLSVAYEECALLLVQAIKQIQNRTADRLKQESIHHTGFYCGKRGGGDEIINWNQSSRQLFNFIRAICKPGPIARTSINGQEVKINSAVYIEEAPKYINTPGQLLKKTELGFLVKTLDSFIEIRDIESKIRLNVGDKLGK